MASVVGQERLVRYTLKKCSTPAKNLIINMPTTARNKSKKSEFKGPSGYDVSRMVEKKGSMSNHRGKIREEKKGRKSEKKETPLLYSFKMKQLIKSFFVHDTLACRIMGEELSQLVVAAAAVGRSDRLL